MTKSWRDHLKIHPAADLFPLMSEAELRELGEDIKKNGLLSPIIIDGDEELVDGRNRLDAIAMLGMEFEFIRAKRGWRKGKIIGIESYDFDTPLSGAVWTMFDDFETNPYDFVISANLHRRHLTADQKRDLIAKVLKAKPEVSNRQIAKQVKADDKTVANVRRDLESTAEIPKLEKTVGADGKARKQPNARKKTAEKVAERDATEAPTDFDRRVGFVVITALTQIEGLSRSETERFFAALRDRLDDAEREALQEDATEAT
jgi:hypothetical protein